MTHRCPRYLSAFLIGIVTSLLLLSGARGNNPAALRIGMVQSFFHDVPKVLVDIATEPFSAVVLQATGLNGKLVPGGDPFDVARRLSAGELELGVFYGFELAWVREKHPELKPLMIATNKHHQVQAFLLVRNDTDIAGFADLKGKQVSLPARSKEHCRLFLRQRAFDHGQCTPKEYFKQVVASANVEAALDDLCNGSIDAAIVDSLGLEFYKDLKPGCYKQLKVAQESELFPPAVIAYREGGLDEAAQVRIRNGLLRAAALAPEMMKMWKIHAFETAPPDYLQSLAEILKAYPTTDPLLKQP
jgi:ABC-type phosphate/phosphonate transport system substrate-binding protein